MKIQYPSIRRKLIDMSKRDQAMRKSGRWNARIDQINTAALKKIVSRIGWPTIPRVGSKAAHAAWLLAQHATDDRSFQRRCLLLMKKELKGGAVSVRDYAYLTDRVLVGQGERQHYGTQFHTVTRDGELQPYPIERPRELDQRRHKAGLGAFSLYARRLKKEFERWRRKRDRALPS